MGVGVNKLVRKGSDVPVDIRADFSLASSRRASGVCGNGGTSAWSMKVILRGTCLGTGYNRLLLSHVHGTCSSKLCTNTMIGFTKSLGYEGLGLEPVSRQQCKRRIESTYRSRKGEQVRIQDDRISRLLLHGVAVGMWDRPFRTGQRGSYDGQRHCNCAFPGPCGQNWKRRT